MTRDATGDIHIDPTLRVLGATRELLRVDTVESVIAVLRRFVESAGGRTVPARVDDPDALPVDLTFGEGDPLVPAAPAGSEARRLLEVTLPGLVEDARTVASRMRLGKRLALETLVDPLTGLSNRRGVNRTLRRLERGDTVVMLDLDGFKQVNDRLGHLAGDQLLRDLARLLQEQLRMTDHAGRLGGDEFVLMLRGTDPDGATRVVERITAEWEDRHPETFTIGIAIVDSDGGHNALDRADRELIETKRIER